MNKHLMALLALSALTMPITLSALSVAKAPTLAPDSTGSCTTTKRMELHSDPNNESVKDWVCYSDFAEGTTYEGNTLIHIFTRIDYKNPPPVKHLDN